ncbi:MAG: protein kinase, partial [Deltaproteobacteria bacterium]|nr:protein kinase [Deltaproteobacteria bacterium]
MDCPEPTEIADLLDGRLSAVDIQHVEEHLDACSRCAELVAVAVSRGTTPMRTTGGVNVFPSDTKLGRYEVRRWIGRGGMGDVYEGFDPNLERRVAIKVLREWAIDSQSAKRRLVQEAKTLARLSNENVVAALDMGFFGEQVFLVMELVEGPTLAAWLKSTPRTWREILNVFLQAG